MCHAVNANAIAIANALNCHLILSIEFILIIGKFEFELLLHFHKRDTLKCEKRILIEKVWSAAHPIQLPYSLRHGRS